MNKLSADKIAAHYYEMGAKHAQIKLANRVEKAFHKTLNAIIGGSGGLGVSGVTSPHARELIGKIKPVGDIFAKGDAARELETVNKLIASLKAGKVNIGYSRPDANNLAELVAAAAKNKAIVGDGLSTMEHVVDKLPGLGIAAGVGTGLYKGLGALDKKLLSGRHKLI